MYVCVLLGVFFFEGVYFSVSYKWASPVGELIWEDNMEIGVGFLGLRIFHCTPHPKGV